MASKVTFTSVELLSFGRNHKGGSARFEFSLTQKAMQAMGWGEMPEFQHGCDLDGDLAASLLEIIPNDAPLKRHAMTLDTSRVYRFTATRQELEGKRGKGFRWTVQCDVAFSDPMGCKKLEAYLMTCSKSEMRVSYEKQPQQEDLPGTEIEETEEQELLEAE